MEHANLFRRGVWKTLNALVGARVQGYHRDEREVLQGEDGRHQGTSHAVGADVIAAHPCIFFE